MNKCKIVENGRLNKLEMLSIRGGTVGCTSQTGYSMTEGCQGKGTRYSVCPSGYESCIQATFTSCGSRYTGPSGPAGVVQVPGSQTIVIP